MKKPNPVIYFFVYIIFYPLLKLLYGAKADRSGYTAPKGSFIVLTNHTSFFDFLIAMLPFYPIRLNPVAARKFFYYKPLHKLLPMMGVIPKMLFSPDVGAIRDIKSVIKRGGHVILFPEGRCSSDGMYAGIHKSTGKLIKSLGIPVVSCRIDGAYITMPFWRRRPMVRRKIRVSITNLFGESELQTLEPDEINRLIDRRLSGADSEPKPITPIRNTKHVLENLHDLLYICPSCESEYTLAAQGDTITCTHCGASAALNEYEKLVSDTPCFPETIHDWYAQIVKIETGRLKPDMKPISLHVVMRQNLRPGGGDEYSGEGELTLSPEGWRYTGTIKKEPAELFFPISQVPVVPFDTNDDFQLCLRNNLYLVTPDNKHLCAKFAVIGECAHSVFAKEPLMTLPPAGRVI